MNLIHRSLALVSISILALMMGCQTTPDTEVKKANLEDDAQASLARFKRDDPGINDLVNRSYGYVIFPNAGKGAFIVGAAYGKGIVYEQGRMIGYADITQGSVGAQIGGQTFSELIAFETREAMERFKNNQLAFTANASAVIIKTGVATASKFENGVAVFVESTGGAMADASVGGQKFTFAPLSSATTRPSDRERTTHTETRTETREKGSI